LRRPNMGPKDRHALLATPQVDSDRKDPRRKCWYYQTPFNGGQTCVFHTCRFTHAMCESQAEFDALHVPEKVTKDRNRAAAVREGSGQKVEDLKLPVIRKKLGCFMFKQLGSCARGDACDYSHDPKVIAETNLPPGYVERAQKLLAAGMYPQDDEAFLEEMAKEGSVQLQACEVQDVGVGSDS
jgi:hypothetical protein